MKMQLDDNDNVIMTVKLDKRTEETLHELVQLGGHTDGSAAISTAITNEVKRLKSPELTISPKRSRDVFLGNVAKPPRDLA